METATEAPRTGASAVTKAADTPDNTTPQERSEALAWFLDPEPDESAYDYVELNVGGRGANEKWVRFKIQSLQRERITQIREESTRGRGDDAKTDANEANLKIAVEGLIDPDLSKTSNRKVRGQQYQDPADALVARFAHKGGLIDQLAGAVVELSGYDEKDKREVRAAGN